MNYKERVLFGCLFLLLPISGFACSMAEWTAAPGVGDVSVGTPKDNPAISRFSESCGLRALATANPSYVQDNNPAAHETFIARFYVRPALTAPGAASADLFVVYDSDTPVPADQLFKVSYDGSNFNFHGDSSTVLGTAAASTGLWHLVEVEYKKAPTPTVKFWVNKNALTPDTPNGSYTIVAGNVESVRLGLPNAKGSFTGGSVNFDSYESHSTTAVGPLIVCDADGLKGGTPVNTLDFVAIIQERYEGILAAGQPDCNLDGAVNSLDVVKAIEIRYGI